MECQDCYDLCCKIDFYFFCALFYVKMCHCRPCHLTPSNPLQPWRLNCLVLSILPLFSGHNQLCCQELTPSFLFPSNSSTGTCVRPGIFQLGCQREGIFSNPEWDEVLFKSANREQRGTSEVKGCVCVWRGMGPLCVNDGSLSHWLEWVRGLKPGFDLRSLGWQARWCSWQARRRPVETKSKIQRWRTDGLLLVPNSQNFDQKACLGSEISFLEADGPRARPSDGRCFV